MSAGTGNFKEFLYACTEGDLERAKAFYTPDIDLDHIHPEFLYAPLHISIRNGHFEVAQYLLENGANPHLKEGYSPETPLSIARMNNDQRMLQLLNRYGVDVHPSFFRRLKQRLADTLNRIVSI